MAPRRPGTGRGTAGPRRSRSRGTAELALFAGPAWFTGPRGAGSRAAGVAELAEDLAQPVVRFLEDRRAGGEVGVREGAEPGHGRVDPGVAGGDGSQRRSFWSHSRFLPSPVARRGLPVRYPPA